jgi:hypothetical protein
MLKHMQRALVVSLGVIAAASGCAPAPQAPKLSILVDAKELPADGVTPTQVTVTVDPPADGVVVRLSTGIGALSHTSVALKDGKGSATLWPPFEAELGAQPSVEVHLTAEVLLQEGAPPLTASAAVTVVPPAIGLPVLVLAADPPRVRADGESAIVVSVEGRRIPAGTVVALASDEDVGVPASITLDDNSRGELLLAARTEPVAFRLTASADGVPPFSIDLAFLSDDAPLYSLTGTFAQIAYGAVSVSGLGIDPSPQTVNAPTLSKVTIVQDETSFQLTFETCAVQMPIVCLAGFGGPSPSTTTPGPGFVDAIPDGTMVVPIRGREPGAIFEPDASEIEAPLVVGADLQDPSDALPTDEDDARLTDPDGDNAPGVTVTNSTLGSDQHIVYRTRTLTMRGVIESSDSIDGSSSGSLLTETETRIVNGDFLSSTFAPEVNGLPSKFRMVRVDGLTGLTNIAGNDGVSDDISCADVRQYLANPANLLAPPPSDTCVTD